MIGGTNTALRTRLALVGAAALALAGTMGAGHAEPVIESVSQITAAIPDDGAPRFEPSSNAASESGFASPSSVADMQAEVATTPDPVTQDLGTGIASFYGRGLAGHSTASGERFDPAALTAAHRTLPFGSKVRVTNPRNGRSVVVTVNDRGPFSRSRLIDLSRGAAEEIGIVAAGHGSVELALLAG